MWGFRPSTAALANTGRNHRVFSLISPIRVGPSRATVTGCLGQPGSRARNTATGTKEVKIGTGSPKAIYTISRTLPSTLISTATRPIPPPCGVSDSSSSYTGLATQLVLLASGVAVPNAQNVWITVLILFGWVGIYAIWCVSLATGWLQSLTTAYCAIHIAQYVSILQQTALPALEWVTTRLFSSLPTPRVWWIVRWGTSQTRYRRPAIFAVQIVQNVYLSAPIVRFALRIMGIIIMCATYPALWDTSMILLLAVIALFAVLSVSVVWGRLICAPSARLYHPIRLTCTTWPTWLVVVKGSVLRGPTPRPITALGPIYA